MTGAFLPPPGLELREAHAHLPALGQSLRLPDVSGCGSVGACLARVREEAARARAESGAAPFARLAGARVEGWAEARWPTLAELDEAGGGVPVVIMGFDHHSGCANTAALRAAGLEAGTPVGAHGVVCVDARSGAATGQLLEDAAYAAWRAAPEAGPEERSAQVAAALAHLAGLGYAQVHDLHSPPWLGPLLAEMDDAGALPMPVTLFAPAAGLGAEAEAARAWGRARVRLGGGKVFADGTLSSRTAAMIHRYAEPLLGHPRGMTLVSPQRMDELVAMSDGLGLPLAVHAIGDNAVRTVLDSVERVKPATRGYRVEHAEIIDAADVGRFARLGVVCSVQPCHLLTDIEALSRYVPHRLERVMPLRELLESGATVWFGSDAPIVGADPGDSIRAAVERRREGMGPEEAVAAKQAITPAQAWACFDGRGRVDG